MLVGVKPKRKGLPSGNVEIDYYTPFQQLTKGNKLAHLVSGFNKISVKGSELQKVNLFMTVFQREYPIQ